MPRAVGRSASSSRSADGVERPRIVGALTSEGFVLEVESVPEGLARLADESFDLAILDLPDAELQAQADAGMRAGRDPLAAWRELRPFTDLVLIGDGDPVRAGQAFAREVAAVLPRPLPEVDALLRAHVKRLAGFRRARTRGLLVLNAYSGIRDELAACGAGAGRDAGRAGQGSPARSDHHRARRRGAGRGRRHRSARTPTRTSPSSAWARATTPDIRLSEARARTAGAALVVVDDAPTADRLASAIYGGARAYLPRSALELLGRVAAATAARRHGEALGMRIVETLAKHGILAGAERVRAAEPAARRRHAADRRHRRRRSRTARSCRPGTRCWWSTTRRSC